MLCVKAEWRFRKILRLPVRKLLSIHPVRTWRLASWKDLRKKELKEASENGWRKEFQAHMDKIHEFWDVSDVQIYDDETLQQGNPF